MTSTSVDWGKPEGTFLITITCTFLDLGGEEGNDELRRLNIGTEYFQGLWYCKDNFPPLTPFNYRSRPSVWPKEQEADDFGGTVWLFGNSSHAAGLFSSCASVKHRLRSSVLFNPSVPCGSHGFLSPLQQSRGWALPQTLFHFKSQQSHHSLA